MGINSTKAHTALIIESFSKSCNIVKEIDKQPVIFSQVASPIEPSEEPNKNAKDPAMDLLLLKTHLLLLPNLLPTISARPSPIAMADRAITPAKLSLQKTKMDPNSTKV
mmetsp:Transcript_15264/g.21778  ORF Transcript_15264/g.21778 Transcript_15264/m.21778 type:complete len:109 (-) Transcript_15264:843-1169(-)